MATRLYFSDLLTPDDLTPDGAAGWNNPTTMTTRARLLARRKLGDPLLGTTIVEAQAAVINQGIRQHISEELAAQTISGTYSLVISGFESATTADNALQCIIRVISQDGATTQATLYAGQSAALNTTAGALGQEFPITTSTTRLIPSGTSLSSYACVAGDRLSVETGYRSYDVSATSDSVTLRYGHPTATADYALTAGLTTVLVPWVEFSANLLFAGARLPVIGAQQAVNRAGSF